MGALGYGRADLGLIVLTHAHMDHCGCLPALLQGSGARLAAHPLAEGRLRGEPVPLPRAHRLHGRLTRLLFPLGRPWLANPPLAVDLPLADGAGLEEWGLPAGTLHTPGHSADSLTLLLENGSAFVGDLLNARGSQACPQPYFIEDEGTLAASVVRLRSQRPRRIYTSDRQQPLALAPAVMYR